MDGTAYKIMVLAAAFFAKARQLAKHPLGKLMDEESFK